MDTADHPNQTRYPGQRIYVVEVNGYLHLVPFVTQSDGTRFLKTIIQAVRHQGLSAQKGLKTMTYRLDQEEKDILESFERGELVPVANPEQEKEYAIQAARNT